MTTHEAFTAPHLQPIGDLLEAAGILERLLAEQPDGNGGVNWSTALLAPWSSTERLCVEIAAGLVAGHGSLTGLRAVLHSNDDLYDQIIHAINTWRLTY